MPASRRRGDVGTIYDVDASGMYSVNDGESWHPRISTKQEATTLCKFKDAAKNTRIRYRCEIVYTYLFSAVTKAQKNTVRVT